MKMEELEMSIVTYTGLIVLITTMILIGVLFWVIALLNDNGKYEESKWRWRLRMGAHLLLCLVWPISLIGVGAWLWLSGWFEGRSN
jgi:hypothetical protein